MNGGIAFSGRAASGKSTLARAVADELYRSAAYTQVFSFADEIKREVAWLYGIRKADPGGRELLIRHGEARRLEDPLYWVRKLEPGIRACQASGIVPIVDDLRFEAEAYWLQEHDFYLVRVVAPSDVRERRLRQRGADPLFAYSQEPSEAELDYWEGFGRRLDTGAFTTETNARGLLRDWKTLVQASIESKKGDAEAPPAAA